jgi:REP element-mobilizing transposase RayT
MSASNSEFSNERIPQGYLITFRSYGTWLHGRAGSVDRFHNRYETPKLDRNNKRIEYNARLLKHPPVSFNGRERTAILAALKETSRIRKWDLWAANIRSNHVHLVVSGPEKPERIMNAFKANATRTMCESGCWLREESPWARGGSNRYLWNERGMQNAIAYVLYEQGESLMDD